MTCQRCNISDRPAARCLVAKDGADVERELCRECRDLTRLTYPVTVLEGPQDGEETPQDGSQTASAETAAAKPADPKARGWRAIHRQGPHAGAGLCGQSGDVALTYEDGEVTCRRCLAAIKREDS